MQNVKLVWFLGVLSLSGAAASDARQNDGAAERAVVALEKQWAQSERGNDVSLLAPLLADRFVYTGTDGRQSDKTAFLQILEETQWTDVQNEDLKATVFGDTVVVTGTFRAKGTASGKLVDEHTRYTDIWVKMPNGRWQCVSSQDSPIRS